MLAAFPADAGDELAAASSGSRWRTRRRGGCPALFRHLRATAAVSPQPAARMLYVDALATDPAHRRRGVARALLAEADRMAAAAGLGGVALDTGLENRARPRALRAQRLHPRARCGPAPDERTARAVGGSGFVGYVKRR